MNLYQLYSKPKELPGYESRYEVVPELIWAKANLNEKELKKKEHILALDPYYAYMYARDVIEGRFPAGEPVIATHSVYSYLYAEDVIGGRFPEGEAAIALDPEFALDYAKNVIEGRFPAGEKAISSDKYFAREYEIFLGWLE